MLRGGVESITPIGSTTCRTGGPFTVVDAKIVCMTFLRDDDVVREQGV